MDLMVCPAQTDEHCLAPQQPFVAAAGWSAVLGIAGQGSKVVRKGVPTMSTWMWHCTMAGGPFCYWG